MQRRSAGPIVTRMFVIDGRYAIQGGQAPEAFAQALRQAMAAPARHPGPALDDGFGGSVRRVLE